MVLCRVDDMVLVSRESESLCLIALLTIGRTDGIPVYIERTLSLCSYSLLLPCCADVLA